MITTKRKNPARALVYTLLILFVLSLIPLYVMGLYAHPSVDDYFYGARTKAVWQETHSLTEVMSSAAAETGKIYDLWQGNFSALFLMHLQPGIYGEEYYFIAPFLLITAYAVCSLFFFYTVLRRIFRTGRITSGAVSIAMTFVSMQLANVPSDSFYWYNGAIYYTFFYSLMLLLFSLLIILRTMQGAGFWLLSLLSIALAFFIGGSNYATALFTAVMLALICGAAIYYILRSKNKTITAKHGTAYVLIAAACLAGLFISMAAPGNANRQASVGGSTGLIRTFAYTFAFGGYSLANVLSAPCLVFFLCMVPVFYRIARNVSFTFRCPLFVLIFTFGLYCSAGTPVFYAQGLRMPYRLMNIICFSAYSWTGFNLIYFLGWIGQKYGSSPVIQALEHVCKSVKSSFRSLFTALLLCITAFAITCIGRIQVAETEYQSGRAGFSNMPVTLSALYSLATGEAAQYDRELNQRNAYLSQTTESNVAVPPLSVYPELIFHTDITSDPEDWRNSHIALFYGKDRVWIE